MVVPEGGDRPTDGSHLRPLTHYRGGDWGAFAGSYSPDGRWIVFRVESLQLEQYKLMKLYPMAATAR